MKITANHKKIRKLIKNMINKIKMIPSHKTKIQQKKIFNQS